MNIADHARRLPKAELHIHIEGSLEPELMFALAKRNGVDLPYASVEAVRAAYDFSDLQSFLGVYYQAAQVLVTEDDFTDLMAAYLRRADADGVRRAEIFFDPQTHTSRGVSLGTVIRGLERGINEVTEATGISVGLIMCFLRHLGPDAALETWTEAEPFLESIIGIGLDSSEVGHPPDAFTEVYRNAHSAGLHTVAHAGEEGPAAYIASALDDLGVERIDHGVRCIDDDALVDRLVAEQVPLTMCPLSNVRLRVFDRLEEHPLAQLLNRGVKVTINSDDPSYFGGYVLDNYVATASALHLSADDLAALAANSIEASFLPEQDKKALLAGMPSAAGSHSTDAG